MKICSKCGASINDESKFCTECGAKYEVESVRTGGSSVRIQEFSGKITKCPNCGEVLKAIGAKCSACGFELREVGIASSVKEFSEKLNKTVSLKQKIELIRNFPIPSAKADIFEFLVLATSNFDAKKHLKATGTTKEMSEAWLGKIEQCYNMAEALFKNDKDFEKFQTIYDSDIKVLKEVKVVKKNTKHYFYGSIMMIMAAMVFLIVMLKGSGIIANPRLDITALGFFANGVISYMYAGKQELKKLVFIVYGANVLLNLAFCLLAPGHVFHVLIIVACGLGTFIDKKSN